MKMVAMALAALMLPGLVPVARGEGAPVTLFACTVGKKTVSVTRTGDQVTYRYGAAHSGAADADELTIVGTPNSGNVFQMAQRYAGMEYQLRFTNGEFSYTVYASEGNPRVGAQAVSGLVVTKGAQRISDKSCARYATLSLPDDLQIPADTDAFSAM